MSALLLTILFAAAPAADLGCFKAHGVAAIADDAGRYLLTTDSKCAGYPSVYLRMRFEMRDGTFVDTFESFHAIAQGRRWFEFAYPAKASGFVRVIVRDAVATIEEAMR